MGPGGFEPPTSRLSGQPYTLVGARTSVFWGLFLGFEWYWALVSAHTVCYHRRYHESDTTLDLSIPIVALTRDLKPARIPALKR